MPSLHPLPQAIVNGSVNITEGIAGSHVPVVIGPAPYFGVERSDQGCGISVEMFADGFPDITKERFHVFLGRLDDEFAVVLAYILSQKIKSVIYSNNSVSKSGRAAATRT